MSWYWSRFTPLLYNLIQCSMYDIPGLNNLKGDNFYCGTWVILWWINFFISILNKQLYWNCHFFVYILYKQSKGDYHENVWRMNSRAHKMKLVVPCKLAQYINSDYCTQVWRNPDLNTYKSIENIKLMKV